MKRTTPTKMKRTTKRKIVQPDLGLGGYMPYPPNDCKARRLIYTKLNIVFINHSSCCRCETAPICQRRKDYDQEWKEYRRRKNEQ